MLNILKEAILIMIGVGRSSNHHCHIMGKKNTTFETIKNKKRQPGVEGMGIS